MAKPPIRKPKKKVCLFCQEKVARVDYKDTATLRKFISDRGKIRARRVSGNCTQAPARRRDGDQERPRDGAAAVHEHGSLRPREVETR